MSLRSDMTLKDSGLRARVEESDLKKENFDLGLGIFKINLRVVPKDHEILIWIRRFSEDLH